MSSLPQPAPTRVALYARVSTEDQADRGTIQAQLDWLRRYCDLHGLEIAAEYVDDGISGTVPLDHRPDGHRLLLHAGGGSFATVILYRLDRLGRSLTSLLDAHAALEQAGVTVRSATEPFDTSTAIGKFLFQLLASLAELEKSTITERMTMGRDRVAKGGKWTGGPLSFGYDVTDGGDVVLSEHVVSALALTEAELARDIFQRIADGSGIVAEARRLQSLGVPNIRRYGKGLAKNGGAWTARRISYMMRSPIYKGQLVLNSRHGRIERQVPPLVSPELWERARRQIERNRSLPPARRSQNVYLLRGLIDCEDCGAKFTGYPMPSRGRTTHYYRCNSRSNLSRVAERGPCDAKLVNVARLEQQVWEDSRAFILNPGDALARAQAQLRERMTRTTGLEEQRRAIARQLADKEGERERIMTLYRRNRIRIEEAEQQLDDVARETSELQGMIQTLRSEEELARASEAHLASAAAMLATLRDQLEEVERTNDRETMRRIVEHLVTRIGVRTVGKGREKTAWMRIIYTFSSPVQYALYDTARRTSACTGPMPTPCPG